MAMSMPGAVAVIVMIQNAQHCAAKAWARLVKDLAETNRHKSTIGALVSPALKRWI